MQKSVNNFPSDFFSRRRGGFIYNGYSYEAACRGTSVFFNDIECDI